MTLQFLSVLAFVLAAIPCALCFANLRIYRRLPRNETAKLTSGVSVLIPARNEEKNIRATVTGVFEADSRIIRRKFRDNCRCAIG